MMSQKKASKWCMFDFDENEPPKKLIKENSKESIKDVPEKTLDAKKHEKSKTFCNINGKNWMKNFDPVKVEDLAVHNKKVQEVEDWLKSHCDQNKGHILLLTGPVGCGKTITISTLAAKYNIKVTEWITPLDIGIPSEYGDFEHKEKQSSKFLDFIINAANFTSLLDDNNRKLVLVEDFPNTFLRTSTEFSHVLQQYKHKARSPIVFICSETHSDNKNTAVNLFTPSLKEQFNIQQIAFNSVSITGLKGALKRVAEIISKKHTAVYNIPTSDMIDCVVNSSGGDVRSAVLNLHFACLKGSNTRLETSILVEKDTKSKVLRKKKQVSNKFLSIGKDQTVSILHGVGRVLNPKVTDGQKLTHKPSDIIEQFLSQPSSFINFLEENYLPHFSSADHADKAAAALSDADHLLAEWREKMCQEYGLYTAVAGMMLANKAPLSAWNPVRGPKNMRIQYPSPHELGLEPNFLYKGKVLVADYQTYCKLISSKT